MSAGPRRAHVRALAKINLGLKVLGRRPDSYHELRTVFQTVSLADSLELEFEPGRSTAIEVASSIEIPANLVERAAALTLEALEITGRVSIRLRKRIPLGAGLGGGSSDAAAVLLALPPLARKALRLEKLFDIAACLGSDVPFFLLGGTAVALGRGTEVYPLPDRAAAHGLLVAPGIHVSTPEAYAALGAPELTSAPVQNIISSFQSFVWQGDASQDAAPPGTASTSGENDFEPVVFAQHPRLRALKRRLLTLGASPVLLSGSGCALFGLFAGRAEADRARAAFAKEGVFSISLVSRARYRALWRRWLGAHTVGKVWPPQSRFA